MKEEIWRDVNGYKGFYKVSNLGNIKSLKRIVNHSYGGIKTLKERIISNTKNSSDYIYSSFSKNGICVRIYLHRVVALAFIPNPENKPQINHKDGNKSNNKIENLEWCTSKENTLHAIETGLNNSKGENNSRAKLTFNEVIEIRSRLGNGELGVTLSKEFNVSKQTITNLKNNKTYKIPPNENPPTL